MGTELEKKGKSKIISVLDLVNGMSPNPPHIKHSTASAFYACCKEWNAAKQTNKQKPREQNRTVNTPKLKHLETKIELQGSCFPYMLTQWA